MSLVQLLCDIKYNKYISVLCDITSMNDNVEEFCITAQIEAEGPGGGRR